jgi:hypothetical protein
MNIVREELCAEKSEEAELVAHRPTAPR